MVEGSLESKDAREGKLGFLPDSVILKLRVSNNLLILSKP